METNHEEKIKPYRLTVNDVLKADTEALAIFLVMLFRDTLCSGIPWIDSYCQEQHIESDDIYSLEDIMNLSIGEEVEICKKWLSTDAAENHVLKTFLEKNYSFQKK